MITLLMPYLETILHTLITLSIIGLAVGFLLGSIPIIDTYRTPILLVSILVLSFCLYREGAASNEAEWQLKVAQLEQKVAMAGVESAELNTKLAEQLSEYAQLKKEKQHVTTKIITETVTKYDNRCELSNIFVRVHDSASKNELPGSPAIDDGDASAITASAVLSKVTDNYSTCYDIRDKLIKWQAWYTENKKIFESINAGL